MARLAVAQGETVLGLVLIEPVLPDVPRRAAGVRRLGKRIRRVLAPDRPAPRAPSMVRPGEELIPDRAKEELAHFRRILPQAVRSYRARPLDVPIIYYASLGNGELRRTRWGPLAQGPFEVVELPATHDHIVAEPVVGVLARDLQARLEAWAKEARAAGV